MYTCIKCGKENPEHTLRFVAVKVNSNSTTTYRGRKQITTTTTTETLDGVDRCSVCESCIRKKRIGNAIGTAIASFLGAYFFYIIFAAFFINKKYFNTHVPGIFKVGAIISAIIAIIVIIVCMSKETPFVGAMILKKKRGADGKGKVYVPVEQSLYLSKTNSQPDINVFKTKTGLKTAVGTGVYMQFIATGTGNQLVDQMLLEQQTAASGNVTLTSDQNAQ